MNQYLFESEDIEHLEYIEVFYCPINSEPMETLPLVQFPIHHTHFRILSRIVLVKIGIYEGYKKLNLFYPKNSWSFNSDELDDLKRLHSWETKILLFSKKIFFKELTEKEINNLYLDFSEIKSDCNQIWEWFVSWEKGTLTPIKSESTWLTKRDSIKKKFKIWRQFWGKIYYHKTQDKFFKQHSLGPDYGMSDCYGLDGNVFKR
jgi:hypothetical protein